MDGKVLALLIGLTIGFISVIFSKILGVKKSSERSINILVILLGVIYGFFGDK